MSGGTIFGVGLLLLLFEVRGNFFFTDSLYSDAAVVHTQQVDTPKMFNG